MTMASDASIARLGRTVRLGFVGGGLDSVIGSAHLVALRADGMAQLVAGAFSIDPEISRQTGRSLLLDESRVYPSWQGMLADEQRREDRIDAVVVITPPALHGEISSAFLEAGFHVLCEKPMTATAEQAESLHGDVTKRGRVFAVAHCYTGYPMVREARELVAAGAIGEVRMVEAEHAAGGPDMVREPADRSRRHWRFRESSMGKASVLGEVGSHPHNIAEYVSGRRVTSVSAALKTLAADREVYDNAYLTVEYEGGVVGRIWSSYVAAGSEHGLRFRVFGDEGSLQWRQEDPEYLWLLRPGEPAQRISRGLACTSPAARAATRIAPGHPEGYLMAFANIYRDFLAGVVLHSLGEDPFPALRMLPTVDDGLSTMELIKSAVTSHASNGQWTQVRPELAGGPR
jgi:predicted dehydrogenase